MEIISDSVWNVIKDCFPVKKSSVGRPPLDKKLVLEGIIFIMNSGAQWRLMPKKYGSKSAVHATFRLWIKEKIFEKIMNIARAEYLKSQSEDWQWFATDTSFSKAPLASIWSGKNPTDRGRQGIKKSVIVDKNGAPLAVYVGPANAHDSKYLFDTINELNKVFVTPAILVADSAYDTKKLRKKCTKLNIVLLASTNKRNDKNRQNFKSKGRWIVEQFFGIIHWKRGLKICWAKTLESFLSFLQLAAAERLFRLARISG